MTPDQAKLWVDVLTQGRGLLITAAVVMMLAGIGLTLVVGTIIAWKAGAYTYWKKSIVNTEDLVDVFKDVVRAIDKCKGPQT